MAIVTMDGDGSLVCLCVYRKGAAEVVRRLQQALEATQQWQDTNGPTKEVQGPGVPCELWTSHCWDSGRVALPWPRKRCAVWYRGPSCRG